MRRAFCQLHGHLYYLSPQVRKECNIPGKAVWQIGPTTFEIDDKYTPIKTVGKGAYGVVCSAKNAQTGEKVAIKKIGKVATCSVQCITWPSIVL